MQMYCYNIHPMAQSVIVKNQEISVGDTVVIHQTIEEGKKTRVQSFEGIVIAIQNREENKSFVVRKIATGSIGVEKIYPVLLPSITKVVLKRSGHVNRSKLYYLREKVGKRATKVKERKITSAAATA